MSMCSVLSCFPWYVELVIFELTGKTKKNSFGMSILINWSTSELLVLMEAIQYCQKMNLQDWGQVSLVVKQTMKETGVVIDKKYDEYGCSKQYNDFVITHKQELEKGEKTPSTLPSSTYAG